MKKTITSLLFLVVTICASVAQTYPFQNTTLSDDERLDNLLSLMTLEEKIDNLSPRPPGVPRLGAKGIRIVEGLHGLAHSGPANWAVKGPGEAPTTTFPNTVLVLVSSFPYAIPWSKEHVPAIFHITQSSQELGNGLADILFDVESPAARLVQTWTASIEQLLPILDYNIRNGRTYLYDKNEPLFAFGHGLSYTRFEYKNLKISPAEIQDGGTVNVTLDIENTGRFSSDEVVQVYAAFPVSKVERPAKALKGFLRVHIPAGQTKTVTIPVKAQDLKYWDVGKDAFVLEKGKVELMVGAASDDVRGEVRPVFFKPFRKSTHGKK